MSRCPSRYRSRDRSSESRVRPSDCKIVTFVKEIGGLGENDKAVREATGNPELSSVLFAQLDGNVTPKIRAPDAHVYGNIQHLAAECGHQLSLCDRILQVQPAKYALDGTGHIVLDERATDAVLGVAGELIGFEKKAALIAEQLGLDDDDVGNLGPDDIHFTTFRVVISRLLSH